MLIRWAFPSEWVLLPFLDKQGGSFRSQKQTSHFFTRGGGGVKVSMYSNYTTLILSDERSIQHSFELVERYEHTSEATLNQQKTNGIFLDKCKHESPGPVDGLPRQTIVGLFQVRWPNL